MAVSILETIKSAANAGNTAYIVILQLLCDTASDLPTQYGLTGYELAQGCKAHIIDTNTDYMLDSTGTWHIYGGGIWQNVYTKSETDTLLDDKQDELTTAQLDAVNSGITAAKLTAYEAALAEVVDSGAKNLLGYSLESLKSLNAGNWNNNVFTIAGVDITINDDWSVLIDGTATAGIYFRLTNTLSQSLMAGKTYVLSGCENGAADTYGIYTGTTGQWDNYSGGTEKEYQSWNNIYIFVRSGVVMDNAVLKPMICTKPLWAVSQKYVPYAPTNRELYEMILALQ